MQLMEKIKNAAKSNVQRIVLPEGNEARIVKAAEQITKEGLAKITLLGKKEEIEQVARDTGVDLSEVEIIDPERSSKLEAYGQKYYELRKHKGITKEQAVEQMKDVLYYSAMMVKMGDADGSVAGAINTTGDVLRPAFQIIKTAPGISVVSGAFFMVLKHELMPEGLMVFADCAVNPNPDARQLAEIAVSSARTAKALANIEPRVALLSFSTKGSASHELVEKVQEATRIAKEMAPEFQIDGELQADAAIVPEIGKRKAPESAIAGQANVLVFPDLQAGNIGYKLVQRLAKADAIGPILQGMAKPVNDLSRGCSVDDVVNLTAITAVQAQNQ
ncbi:phosphate acetyltransferase [Anoxybacter fermentans]|uniref:Phosphate acetyltransferase n=1 Tax=Anoxybacter fermentans TaxID=1323375 RepID=A0A3Q9HPG9_9FIRM|nr:phosphate acetyltransferase [Anoxybacter fermentans]AZR72740.1 phosphate acetyltransferase [Anoxybacter fermentans]